MKKKYEKPMIVFEDFSLNTTIAGGCGVPTQTPSSGQCGIDFSGVMIFLEGMNGCIGGIEVDNIGGDGEYNGICYHVPTDGNNIFNS